MLDKKSLSFFFIIGAAKCGTTSLHYYLNQHSQIIMSKPKETLFFEKDFVKDKQWYINQYFKGLKDEKFLGEARQRNLYLPYVPERMASLFPDAKLIVAVRNPVERAFSHYLHRKYHKFESLSFEEAIKKDLEEIKSGRSIKSKIEIERYLAQLAPDGASKDYRTYIDCGYYAEQIERYLEFFKMSQMLIIFMEDIKKNVRKVYQEILTFIDKDLQYEEIDFVIKNRRKNSATMFLSNLFPEDSLLKRKIPKRIKESMYNFSYYLFSHKAKMRPEIKDMLIKHYWEHNRRLEKITGRDLAHWDN